MKHRGTGLLPISCPKCHVPKRVWQIGLERFCFACGYNWIPKHKKKDAQNGRLERALSRITSKTT